MYKTLLNSIVLLFALNCSLSAVDLDNVVTDSVLVSAKRIPEVYSQTSRIVNIITKDEIMNAPVHTVQGLLEHTASVEVRQRGSHKQYRHPDGRATTVPFHSGSSAGVPPALSSCYAADPKRSTVIGGSSMATKFCSGYR